MSPSVLAPLAALALTASVAFAQTPAFTVVNHGLDATFGNAGKGIFDPQVSGITGVAFGNGLFVVIGASGNEDVLRWATSPDGTTWTARSQALTGGLKTFSQSRVHFLNGKFVFFAEHTAPNGGTGGGGFAYFSTDGLTWTRSNVITTERMLIAEFDSSPTMTVAAGTNGRQYASSDLITWTSNPVVPGASGFDHLDLAYGTGRFYSSINGFGGTTYASTDAVTWTSITSATVAGGGRVENGNGITLLTASGNFFRSTDGVAFSRYTPTVPSGFLAVGADPRFTGGRFVSQGVALTGTAHLGSSDGLTWTLIGNLPASPPVTPVGGVSRLWIYGDIVFGNGKYVQVANESQQTVSTRAMLPLIMTIDAAAAPTPPTISAQPAAANAVAGGTATFSVTAPGTGNSYQWRKDGTAITGATGVTLTLSNVTAANAGSYTVVVTNSVGSITSNAATLTLVTASDTGRLVNMSIRTGAGTGDNTLIVGIGLGGAGTSGTKAVLIRGVGPTLSTSFGLTTALADPVMTAFQGQTQIAQNDDWAGGFDFAAVGAFALAGAAPRDAAIYNPAIPSGSYSVQIAGKNNATGIALAEIYDATPTTSFAATTPRLVNVSARTQVGTGDNILIAGFVIGGSTPVRVLVRAVGPTLGAAPFNVGGTLADPKLEIFSGSTKTAENDNWGGTAELKAAFTSVAAFALANDTSRDAALIVTLQPGSYTAQISGIGNTAGVALVEVYELP